MCDSSFISENDVCSYKEISLAHSRVVRLPLVCSNSSLPDLPYDTLERRAGKAQAGWKIPAWFGQFCTEFLQSLYRPVLSPFWIDLLCHREMFHRVPLVQHCYLTLLLFLYLHVSGAPHNWLAWPIFACLIETLSSVLKASASFP